MAKRAVCDKCSRPKKVCFCHTISKIKTDSHILILRHFKEKNHPFNTARMAELSLLNCSVLDTDQNDFKKKLSDFIEEYRPFLIFYNQKSVDIDEHKSNLPSKNFILLDGTWDKAKKVLFSNEALQELPIFHLNPKNETIYAPIRKACSQNFISTIEAVKETLECIYENKKFEELLAPLIYTVNKQIDLKG